MKKRLRLYILFLCVSLLLSGCMNKSVNMLIKLKKGDSYKVEVDSSEKIIQTIKGGDTEVQSKIRIGYLCHVTNIDENKNADITVTFDTIDAKFTTSNGQSSNNKSKGDGGEEDKDEEKGQEQSNSQKQPPSENKEALAQGMDKFSKIYNALVGKSFTIKVGEYGKVKQVVGMDEIVNKLFTEMNIKSEKDKEEIKKVMKDKFGNEAITKKIERITAVYPNKNIKVGESWKEDRDVSNEFPIVTENNYTLKESSDGTSSITVDSKIKGKEEAEPTIVDNIKISYEDIKGTQKGNISLNEETGVIKMADMESKFDGKMKFISDDPNMGSMIFPISVEEKIRVNVLRQ